MLFTSPLQFNIKCSEMWEDKKIPVRLQFDSLKSAESSWKQIKSANFAVSIAVDL